MHSPVVNQGVYTNAGGEPMLSLDARANESYMGGVYASALLLKHNVRGLRTTVAKSVPFRS